MKKCLLFFIVLSLGAMNLANAQTEQLLVDENFQNWTNFTASTTTPSPTPNPIVKTTLISNEALNYTLYGISIANSGWSTGAQAAGVASSGYLKMAKTTEVTTGTMSIILSPLKSITKISFIECTTGSSRGFQVWKKGDGDSDWVSIYSTYAATQTGTSVTNLTVGGTNVSLKFTNLAPTQNAYLSDLKIYGNVTGVAIPPTVSSITPANNATIPTAGDISVVFSENVTRATANDITLGGVVIPESDITVSGATVTIHYSGLSTDSSYGLVIPAGAFINAATTPTGTAITANYKTPDTIAPTLTKMSAASSGAILPITGAISLVMSEPCKAGTATISIGAKTITAAVSASNNNLLYINYSGLDYDTEYVVTIPANAITDLTGNSYAGTSFNIHTAVNAKGKSFFTFTPDATSVPTTSTGDITQTVNTDTIATPTTGILTFGAVASAGARSSSSYTYAFKCNYVQLPKLPSVGELSFYIQSGGGSTPQEYYIQKLAADKITWNTIETIIIGNNDTKAVVSAAAQSSDSTTLRLMYNSSNLWFYTMSVSAFKSVVVPDDGLNPAVTATVPVASATDVAINGTIKLTYHEVVALGVGNITLDGKSLTPSIVGKNISLPYANLKYATQYTLSLPAGAFKDAYNNGCDAFTLTFTTKAKPAVTPKLYDFVVAQDGTGNGTTIQSAFDAVPANNAVQFNIFVKNGTYNEYPTLAQTKANVSLIGQSLDGVIITGSHYSGLGSYTTSTCQTVEILADNFYCENITMQNTAGLTAGQAVALKVYGDKATFKNVKLFGYQDTHLTGNSGTDRQYYLNCDIRGSVDYIFGNGACFFDNCLLYMQDRTTADVICAPSTDAGNTYGYVFNNCTVDGASSQDQLYNLGRPWQNSPRAVYLNTKMKIQASAGGWISMSTIPALFAEYGTVDASNNPVSLSARNTAFSYVDGSSNTVTGSSPTAVLTDVQAANYTLGNVLGGSDSWDATVKPQTTAVPTNLVYGSGNLSWDAVDGSMCYLLVKDGVVKSFTTSTAIPVTENGSYTVISATEYGALSGLSNVVNVSDIATGIATATSNGLTAFSNNGILYVNNLKANSSVEVYTFTGALLYKQHVDSDKISLSVNCPCIVKVVNNQIISILKVIK